MNKEQQRIAIAEACGWNHWFNGWNKLEDNTSPLILTEQLPDYLNDLNAMHEAEKIVTNLYVYGQALAKIIMTEVGQCRGLYPCIIATASQRAEAFLRTLNLWKDE